MTEYEKNEQLGRLAQEYSRLRGEANHVNDKLSRAQAAYEYASRDFQNLRIDEGNLVGPSSNGSQETTDLRSLLGVDELTELFRERNRVAAELHEKAKRLKELTPNLL